jgi:hypothetical protein
LKEALRLAEKHIPGQNHGRKSPFMMRSSSKSQEIKKKVVHYQAGLLCVSKWSRKRLFVKWDLMVEGLLRLAENISGTKQWTEVAIHDEIKLKITGK